MSTVIRSSECKMDMQYTIAKGRMTKRKNMVHEKTTHTILN